MYEILTNPFYYGKMRLKTRNKQLYAHQYEPLIPQWLFAKCQKILEWRASNERGTEYNKKEFVFKGIVRCKACGKKLSTYTQKGINYVACHSCRAVHIREDSLEKQIEGVFRSISIREDALLRLVEALIETHEGDRSFYKTQRNSFANDLSRTRNRLTALYEDRLDRRITNEEYDRMVRELKKKEQDILEEVGAMSKREETVLINASYILELIGKAYELFKGSSTARKRELLNFMFTNLEVDSTKHLSHTIKDAFRELVSF